MSEETKTFSDKIIKLGDEVVGLTLKEAVEFADYMKETYDIEPAAGGAVVMAGGGGDAAPAAEEKSEFDVVLKGDGGNKIKVIKVVREITGLGLKEAKEMVDNLPAKVKTGLGKEEAEQLAEKLKAEGAAVELE